MQTAPSARRSGGLLDRFLVTGTVTQLEPIARRMQRIRIEGDDIAGLDWVPGQHVRVNVADIRQPRNWLRPRDFLRTYTVWEHDGFLELCVLDHAEEQGEAGPGAQWARRLRTGDRVALTRPEGNFVLAPAAYHLFAGEETAAAAFGPMLRAVPPDAAVYGVLEVDQPGDQLPLERPLTWQYRQGRPAADSASLLAAVTRLDLPDEPGAAYLAGEARTVQLLRRHLVDERGWPRPAVRCKPFWTPGRRGLD